MRIVPAALAASLGLTIMFAPTLAQSAPPAGVVDQRVVPDTQIAELGPSMVDVNVRGAAFGFENGRAVAYVSSNGEPATFGVVDMQTGESLFSQELPGYTMLGSVHVSVDGTVYFNGQNPTPGALFRYFPGERRIEHIADGFGGESWLRDVVADEDGTLYLSTYPNGKLLSYTPATGALRDYGTVAAGAAYGYTVEVVGDEVWVGTGTVPNIIAVNKVSGEKRSIPLPEVVLENTNYVLNLQRIGDLVFAGLSPRGGFETWVYDLRTAEWVATIPKVSVSGLTKPIDGKIYHFSGRVLMGFDLETLIPFETTFAATPIPAAISTANVYALETMTLDMDGFSGDAVVGISNTGKLWFFDPATGAHRISTPEVQASGAVIVGLGVGPDGNVYTGAKVGPQLMGRIDAETREISQLRGPSQAEGMGAFGDLMVIGTYSGAQLYVGSLSEPWNWGTNPRRQFSLGRGGPYYQDRIWTMADVGESMALGTIPEPGHNGGALVFADPRTGAYEIHRNLIPDQSVVGLTFRDGVLYGSTSIHGGASTPPVAQRAVVFAWDVAAKRLLWTLEPLTEAQTLGGLAWDPDGDLWAVTEHGAVVQIDVTTQSVKRATQIVPADQIADKHPWSMYSSLVYDAQHDGFFGTVGWKMFFLDRQSGNFGFLREGKDTYRIIQAGNGAIFCVDKSTVCALDVKPKPIDQQAPETTLKYQGNNWVTVSLESVDDISGVAEIRYRLNGGAWLTYEGPIKVKRADRQTISYRAVDKAGNTEVARCFTFQPGGGNQSVVVAPADAGVCLGA